MSNYTNLEGRVFEALNDYRRQTNVGYVQAVSKNVDTTAVAYNQPITYVNYTDTTTTDFTPGIVTVGDDVVTSTSTITMDQRKKKSFFYTGEEVKQLDTGMGYSAVVSNAISTAIQAAVSDIEGDVATAMSATTTAVGDDAIDPWADADSLQILFDAMAELKGAKSNGMNNLIIDFKNIAEVMNRPGFLSVNEAGTSDTLRDGKIGRLAGFDIYETSVSQANVAGYALEEDSFVLASRPMLYGGKADDIMTFSDPNSGLSFLVVTNSAGLEGGYNVSVYSLYGMKMIEGSRVVKLERD